MILVTGGTGYIGSHTVVELMAAGREVVILDNLVNSKASVIDRIARIAKRKPKFIEGDIRDRDTVRTIFKRHPVEAVIHFAGLKAVGESFKQPLEYYDNNVSGSLALVQVMAEAQVKSLVFSSSATVYGEPQQVPIREDAPLSATNPYGQTKLVVENMLRDISNADSAWRIALLRYFNPVGAHPSGLIGEDPEGIPNNLVPFVAQVASGKQPHLSVFGSDYATADGTGMRDYIHVVDLARGHLQALRVLPQIEDAMAINLGTGHSHSVLQMVKAFEAASERPVPLRMAKRRPGDIAECYADASYAHQILDWRAELKIDDMCRDTWRWQQWAESNLPARV